MTETDTIELNGACVRVTVNDAGAVTTRILGPEVGSDVIEHNGDEIPITVKTDSVYINLEIGSIRIPHDGGTIPRVIGHKSLPGWLMGELRLRGFEMCDEYGWSDDDEAPFVPIGGME